MKQLLTLTAFASLTMANLSHAQGYSQDYGNQSYYYGNNGSSYNAQRYGNQTYWSGYDSTGQFHSGSSQRYGNQTFYFGN